MSEVVLLVKLYSKAKNGFKGTVKDYAKLIGGVNWTMTHYNFIKKMVDEGVLKFVGSEMIFGKSYPTYILNKEEAKRMLREFFDYLKNIDEEMLIDVMIESLPDDYMVVG